MNSDVLNLISPDTYSDFPKDIFPKLIEKQKLFGLKIEYPRYAIDSIKKFELAQKAFN